jgi:peptidoglycan hydrolase-like protein with peptidoglycan-binding domain
MPDVVLPTTGKPTLQKGSKGTDVAIMQQRLMAHNVQLPKYGADGDFGPETEAAVKTFQALHALKVDGVCGPDTWAELLKELDSTPDTATCTVTIPGLTEEQAAALLAQWPGATMAVG